MGLLFLFFATAQKAAVTWGEEFKLKKGSTDLEVISSDNSGVYVKESHIVVRGFSIFQTWREAATLTKLDKNLNEIYSSNFNKELKGKEYDRFFFLKDRLYLLATDYSKKEKTLTLFAAEIDKSSGELAGEFSEITSWQKDDKKEDISFNATYNSDSTKMVLVSTIEGSEKNKYEVRQYDEKLKVIGKPVKISNNFDANTFVLEDVVYTNSANIVLVGRVYEYQEGKKKKAKYLDFSNYDIRVYDQDGKMINQINTEVSGKWLVSTKLAQIKGASNEMVLAAFYSNSKRSKDINGMLVNRLNATTGELISSNDRDLSTSMITALETDSDDDGEESREERKEREKLEKIQNEDDGFTKYMRFRNFIYTQDKGLVILAEKYNSYIYTSTTYTGNRMQTTSYRVWRYNDE
jgi:hypothetical protein